MFESWVAQFLTSILGNYVQEQCFSPESLQVGVWGGYISLERAELKKDILDHLQLPLTVQRACVKSITISIPWNRLASEPVKITMDGLYLIAETALELDEVKAEKLLLAHKRQVLDAAELASTSTHIEGGDGGFTSRLINKIVDNLQVTIRNVHLRYEDYASSPATPFSVGVTMESLHLQSTNSSWQPAYVDYSRNVRNSSYIYKHLQLNQAAVYLNYDCSVQVDSGKSLAPNVDYCRFTFEEIEQLFDRGITRRAAEGNDLPPHQFLLRPVNAVVKLKLNRDVLDRENPQREVIMEWDDISIAMEETQYRDVLYLAATFSGFEINQKYYKFRPRIPVHVNPRAWWIYAIEATKADIEEKHKTWTWEYIRVRQAARREYTALWRRHLAGVESAESLASGHHHRQEQTASTMTERTDVSLAQQDSKAAFGDQAAGMSTSEKPVSAQPSAALGEREKKRLRSIEDERPLEDILFFRSLAENQVKVEQAQAALARKMQTESSKGGWSRWLLPSFLHSGHADQYKMSNLEQAELMKLLDFDPTTALQEYSEAPPADYVANVVDMSFLRGSLTLAISSPGRHAGLSPSQGVSPTPLSTRLSQRTGPFLRASWNGLRVGIKNLHTTTLMSVSLQMIEAFDQHSRNQFFSKILASQAENLNDVRASSARIHTWSDGFKDPASVTLKDVFKMDLQLKPSDTTADAAIKLTVEPLELVYLATSPCWAALTTFLNATESLGTWRELQVAAMNQFDNLKARTQAKLEYALANRFALALDVEIKAPAIIIPEDDGDERCPRLIVDLGSISLSTTCLGKIKDIVLADPADSRRAVKMVNDVPDGGKPSFSEEAADKSRQEIDDRFSHQGSLQERERESEPLSLPPDTNNPQMHSPAPDSPEGERSKNIKLKIGSKAKTSVKNERTLRQSQQTPRNRAFSFISDDGRLPMDAEEAVTQAEAEARQWEESFYDAYHLKMSNVQVLFSPAGDPHAWRVPAMAIRCRMPIVDRFDINLSLKTSVLPQDATLTRLFIEADLSPIKLQLSDRKYKQLLTFADCVAKHTPNASTDADLEEDDTDLSTLYPLYTDPNSSFTAGFPSGDIRSWPTPSSPMLNGINGYSIGAPISGSNPGTFADWFTVGAPLHSSQQFGRDSMMMSVLRRATRTTMNVGAFATAGMSRAGRKRIRKQTLAGIDGEKERIVCPGKGSNSNVISSPRLQSESNAGEVDDHFSESDDDSSDGQWSDAKGSMDGNSFMRRARGDSVGSEDTWYTVTSAGAGDVFTGAARLSKSRQIQIKVSELDKIERELRVLVSDLQQVEIAWESSVERLQILQQQLGKPKDDPITGATEQEKVNVSGRAIEGRKKFTHNQTSQDADAMPPRSTNRGAVGLMEDLDHEKEAIEVYEADKARHELDILQLKDQQKRLWEEIQLLQSAATNIPQPGSEGTPTPDQSWAASWYGEDGAKVRDWVIPRQDSVVTSTARNTKALDRKVLVCTFHVPLIQVNVTRAIVHHSSKETEQEIGGRQDSSTILHIEEESLLVVKMLGLQLKDVERSFSSRVSLSLQFLEVEDTFRPLVGGESRYLVCPGRNEARICREPHRVRAGSSPTNSSIGPRHHEKWRNQPSEGLSVTQKVSQKAALGGLPELDSLSPRKPTKTGEAGDLIERLSPLTSRRSRMGSVAGYQSLGPGEQDKSGSLLRVLLVRRSPSAPGFDGVGSKLSFVIRPLDVWIHQSTIARLLEAFRLPADHAASLAVDPKTSTHSAPSSVSQDDEEVFEAVNPDCASNNFRRFEGGVFDYEASDEKTLEEERRRSSGELESGNIDQDESHSSPRSLADGHKKIQREKGRMLREEQFGANAKLDSLTAGLTPSVQADLLNAIQKSKLAKAKAMNDTDSKSEGVVGVQAWFHVKALNLFLVDGEHILASLSVSRTSLRLKNDGFNMDLSGKLGNLQLLDMKRANIASVLHKQSHFGSYQAAGGLERSATDRHIRDNISPRLMAEPTPYLPTQVFGLKGSGSESLMELSIRVNTIAESTENVVSNPSLGGTNEEAVKGVSRITTTELKAPRVHAHSVHLRIQSVEMVAYSLFLSQLAKWCLCGPIKNELSRQTVNEIQIDDSQPLDPIHRSSLASSSSLQSSYKSPRISFVKQSASKSQGGRKLSTPRANKIPQCTSTPVNSTTSQKSLEAEQVRDESGQERLDILLEVINPHIIFPLTSDIKRKGRELDDHICFDLGRITAVFGQSKLGLENGAQWLGDTFGFEAVAMNCFSEGDGMKLIDDVHIRFHYHRPTEETIKHLQLHVGGTSLSREMPGVQRYLSLKQPGLDYFQNSRLADRLTLPAANLNKPCVSAAARISPVKLCCSEAHVALALLIWKLNLHPGLMSLTNMASSKDRPGADNNLKPTSVNYIRTKSNDSHNVRQSPRGSSGVWRDSPDIPPLDLDGDKNILENVRLETYVNIQLEEITLKLCSNPLQQEHPPRQEMSSPRININGQRMRSETYTASSLPSEQTFSTKLDLDGRYACIAPTLIDEVHESLKSSCMPIALVALTWVEMKILTSNNLSYGRESTHATESLPFESLHLTMGSLSLHDLSGDREGSYSQLIGPPAKLMKTSDKHSFSSQLPRDGRESAFKTFTALSGPSNSTVTGRKASGSTFSYELLRQQSQVQMSVIQKHTSDAAGSVLPEDVAVDIKIGPSVWLIIPESIMALSCLVGSFASLQQRIEKFPATIEDPTAQLNDLSEGQQMVVDDVGGQNSTNPQPSVAPGLPKILLPDTPSRGRRVEELSALSASNDRRKPSPQSKAATASWSSPPALHANEFPKPPHSTGSLKLNSPAGAAQPPPQTKIKPGDTLGENIKPTINQFSPSTTQGFPNRPGFGQPSLSLTDVNGPPLAFSISFRMERPEVWLLEDSSKHEGSYGLVIKGDLIIHLRTAPTVKNSLSRQSAASAKSSFNDDRYENVTTSSDNVEGHGKRRSFLSTHNTSTVYGKRVSGGLGVIAENLPSLNDDIAGAMRKPSISQPIYIFDAKLNQLECYIGRASEGNTLFFMSSPVVYREILLRPNSAAPLLHQELSKQGAGSRNGRQTFFSPQELAIDPSYSPVATGIQAFPKADNLSNYDSSNGIPGYRKQRIEPSSLRAFLRGSDKTAYCSPIERHRRDQAIERQVYFERAKTSSPDDYKYSEHKVPRTKSKVMEHRDESQMIWQVIQPLTANLSVTSYASLVHDRANVFETSFHTVEERDIHYEVKGRVKPGDARIAFQDIPLFLKVSQSLQELFDGLNPKPEPEQLSIPSEGLRKPNSRNSRSKTVSDSQSGGMSTKTEPEDENCYTAPNQNTNSVSITENETSSKTKSSSVVGSVSFDGFKLLVVNDVHIQEVPVLELSIAPIDVLAKMQAQGDLQRLYMSVTSTISVNYYNMKLVAWEPLIEPWECQVEVCHGALLSSFSDHPESSVAETQALVIYQEGDRDVHSNEVNRKASVNRNSLGTVSGSSLKFATKVATSHASLSTDIAPARGIRSSMASTGLGNTRTDVVSTEVFLDDKGRDEMTQQQSGLPAQRNNLALQDVSPLEAQAVTLSSQEILNVNITEALILSLLGAWRSWQWAAEVEKRSSRDKFSIHWIRNLTGVKLWYWGDDRVVKDVQDEGEQPLELKLGGTEKSAFVRQMTGGTNTISARASAHKSGYHGAGKSMTISLSLERHGDQRWRALHHVPVDSVKTRLYQLHTDNSKIIEGLSISSAVCVLDVEVEHGYKLITIRSTEMLKNCTDVPLVAELALPALPGPGSNIPRVLWTVVLSPGATKAVPIHFTAITETELYIRPKPERLLDQPPPPVYSRRKVNLGFGTAHDSAGTSVRGGSTAHRTCVMTFSSSMSSRPVPPFTCSVMLTADDEAESILRSRTSAELLSSTTSKGKGARKQAGRGHLKVMSFHSPLVITNVLALPVEYRLKIKSDPLSQRDEEPEVSGSFSVSTVGEYSIDEYANGPAHLSSQTEFTGESAVASTVRRARSNSVAAGSNPFVAGGELQVAESLLWHRSGWRDTVQMTIRIPGFGWSEVVKIPPCRHSKGQPVDTLPPIPDIPTLFVHLEDSQKGVLSVAFEVEVGAGGTRHIHMYTPYLYLNHSGVPLQLGHDPEVLGSEYRGKSFAAGQEQSEPLHEWKHQAINEVDRRGKIKRRGRVIIPGTNPLRSLRDVIRAKLREESTQKEMLNTGSAGSDNWDSRFSNTETLGETTQSSLIDPVLLGYTNEGKKKGRIRLRAITGYQQKSVSSSQRSDVEGKRSLLRELLGKKRANEGNLDSSTSVNTGPWSRCFSINSTVPTGVVEVAGSNSRRSGKLYTFGVSIATMKGIFDRTKAITMSPRYVLVNMLTLGTSLECRQHGPLSPAAITSAPAGQLLRTSTEEDVIIIPPDGMTPFHWPHMETTRLLQVRFGSYGWMWSGSFSLDDVGDFCLRLRNTHNHQIHHLRVEVKLHGATLFIVFRPENPRVPPYRIENYSLETLRICQKAVPIYEVLLPYHSCSYTWDEPTKSRRLLVDSLNSSNNTDKPILVGSYALDQIRQFPAALNGKLRVALLADGPTRVLRFTDARLQGSQEMDESNGSQMRNESKKRASKDETNKRIPIPSLGDQTVGLASSNALLDSDLMPSGAPVLTLDVTLKGIGISLVDDVPQELIYVSVTNIQLKMFQVLPLASNRAFVPSDKSHPRRLPPAEQIELHVDKVQIDNQMYSSMFPVLLRPTGTKDTNRIAESYVTDRNGRNHLLAFTDAYVDTAEKHKRKVHFSNSMDDGNGSEIYPDDGSDSESLPNVPSNDTGASFLSMNKEVKNGLSTRSEMGKELASRFFSSKLPALDASLRFKGSKPFLLLKLVRRNDFGYPGIDFVRHFSILVMPLEVNLDGSLLSVLLRYSKHLSKEVMHMSQYSPAILDKRATKADTPLAPLYQVRRSRAFSLNVDDEDIPKMHAVYRTHLIPHFQQQPESFESSSQAAAKISMESSTGIAGSNSTATSPPSARLSTSQKLIASPPRSSAHRRRSPRLSPPSLRSLRSSEHKVTSSAGRKEGRDTWQTTTAVSLDQNKKLYFEEMYIHPLMVLVSLSGGHVGTPGAIPSGAAREDTTTSDKGDPLRVVLATLGITLVSIENAPIRLNALHLAHSFATPDALSEQISAHYQRQFLRQAYVLLGSADLLGNPVGLLKHLGAGVKDFFYEPAQGLARSPLDFYAGVAKGTASLIRNSVYGVTNATFKISAIIAVSLSSALMRLDPYSGLKAPDSFVQSLVQGFAGLFRAPYYGAQARGLTGLARGVSAGVIGLFLRPTVAIFLLTSSTSSAIRHAVDKDLKSLFKRARPPRHIPNRNTPLTIYSYEASVGHELISRVLRGKYRSDGFVGRYPSGKRLIVVTGKRIMSVDNDNLYCVPEWEVELQDLLIVELGENGDDVILTYLSPPPLYHSNIRRQQVLYARSLAFPERVIHFEHYQYAQRLVYALGKLRPHLVETGLFQSLEETFLHGIY